MGGSGEREGGWGAVRLVRHTFEPGDYRVTATT